MVFLYDMGILVCEQSFVMLFENGVVVWEFVKFGYGVLMQFDFLGDVELSMERVLLSLFLLQFLVWLVMYCEFRMNCWIRVVFDMIVQGLSEIMCVCFMLNDDGVIFDK